MTTNRSGSARVCLYDAHLAETFKEFCGTVWPGSSLEGDREPDLSSAGAGHEGGNAPTFLFLKNEKAIGHVATLPIRLSMQGRTVPAHWIVGFMVLPEYRNGLVGPLLIKEVNRVLDVALSLHVEDSVLRILTGLKWVHKGVLPQYLLVLNAGEVTNNLIPLVKKRLESSSRGVFVRALVDNGIVRWLAAECLGLTQQLWSLFASVGKPYESRQEIVEERGFDESYSALWQSVSSRFHAAIVRDQEALQLRYGHKMERYRLLAYRRQGKLLGYCILRIKQFSKDRRMNDMKVGTIVDCLYDPDSPAVLQALVTDVMARFRQAGVHAVFCTASLQALRRLLLMNGFFKIPGNLNFAYHARLAQVHADIPLDAWHLMRGDSDADQNF
jgi:Acetyltransferase (GNAT) domain